MKMARSEADDTSAPAAPEAVSIARYEAPLVSPPGSEFENPPIGERVSSGVK